MIPELLVVDRNGRVTNEYRKDTAPALGPSFAHWAGRDAVMN